MPNIPGLPGFQQPVVAARDRIVSRGVSIPGGLRIPAIIGEGLREETIVASAVGGGQDGDDDCSPTGDASGRFFSLANAPVVNGRTELRLNGTLLYGLEDSIDANSFDKDFDYRIDPTTGCIELQGASIGDQDGKNYSASSLNVGNGIIVDGTCGNIELISVVDENAPEERWTVRAVSVSRDSNGDPIPGRASFTLSGSVSGQVRDENGQPIIFNSDYSTGTLGAVSGNADACADGFIVASSSDFGTGSAVSRSGDSTPLTTNQFQLSGDLVSQGQALVGDTLCIDGYLGIEISDIEYNSGTDITTLTLETDSLSTGISTVPWEVRATNLFIDNPSVSHNGLTGAPDSEGNFSSSDIGRVLAICGGDSAGLYSITQVTSSRRVRVEKFQDSTQAFPEAADDDADGLSDTNLTWHVLQSNGVLLFGIKEGTVPFEVGDKFFIDVDSKVLKENDELVARYVSSADLEDPEFFLSVNDLYAKHGQPSETNTLSLGAQMAFENGAPGVFAVQAKPALPRRTSVTLIEEVDSNGNGGFTACGGDADSCEIDDLEFIIPRPLIGLQNARPDSDTAVNIFVVRDGEETQIFPNKVGFYNSQFEDSVGKNKFISSSDFAYSYTIINTETDILGQGFDGELTASDGTFFSTEIDFDSEDVGQVIVLQSVEDSSGTVYTTESEISTYLFGDAAVGVELVITAINDDNTVSVVGNDDSNTAIVADAVDVQFFVKELADTTNLKAALLFNKDLVSSGTLKAGDGIRISYIDELDADYFDTNWVNAYESLEKVECQIVVPLPTQNRSGVFRAGEVHVDTMSSISIQEERVLLIGAQQGLTVNALLGNEEAAIEDIGVLEGIQGDDPEEVLAGNTEDLANYRLSDNWTNERVMYFYPDQIVRNINGTNTFIDGFYLAACAAGWFAGQQNVALPLTNKELTGFSILRDKQYGRLIQNRIGAEGATLVEPITGGGRVLAGRTTSQSGFIEDEEISIIFIRDRVKEVLRQGLRSFLGTVEDLNTQGVLTSRVVTLLSGLVSSGLITGFENVRVEKDKVDPRQWNVFLRFVPSYPINYIFIDIEVGVSA